jgi:YD repeat-containing protein
MAALTNRSAHGQSDFVNIIPPTPAASAMQQYGNTNVGLYTGAANVSIPIHTIKLKELQFPITLSYSGSGGINIQSVASWVGLGWTLSSSGAVSRTIYGLADDKPNQGYLYQPTIPVPTTSNYQTFQDFANGMTDGEPDKYFYNAGGVSGSFYINKQKQVVQVPLTNNRITPEFDLLGKIVSFDLITDRGIVYHFDDHEESRSFTPGGSSTDNNYYTSSWYLSSISNYNNTESIEFHYESYSFYQYAEVYSTRVLDNPGTLFLPRYSVTETNARRLKFITYNDTDTVEFITGGIPRRDLTGEKYLASIEIKEHNRLRKVNFDYSYFDANGVVPITTTATATNSYLQGYLIHAQADGDHFKRLKLDTVSIFSDDGTQSQPYVFEYYTHQNLPSRFSYARDHWGFYNGQSNNSGLEPRRMVDRRPILSQLRGTDFEIVGDANRESSFEHSKAGVLKKVIYPTGGSSEFEYELHQSSLELLPNQKQSFNVGLSPTTLKDTIQLVTINDPAIAVSVNLMGISLSEYCDFTVSFKNLQTGTVKMLGDFFENAGKGTIFLAAGNYEISYVEHDGVGTCFEDFYTLSFLWENEIVTLNKNVGGLRIKKIIDVSGAGETTKRVYSYLLENSTLSSGSLVSIPRYGYYEYANYDNGEVNLIDPTYAIPSYIRMYNTNMPLVTTQGSHVGYKRVEVTTEAPTETGKSVSFFTCPADFPDLIGGFKITLTNGNTEYSYLYPHSDSRDWKRGLLYAQVEYKYHGGQFVRVSTQETHYKIHAEVDAGFDFEWQSQYPEAFIQPSYEFATVQFFIEDPTNGYGLPKIPGVRTHCMPATGETSGCGRLYLSSYDFFAGRVELVSQVQKSYNGSGILTAGTKFTYGNSTYYYPTVTKSSTSRGDSITTTLKYPFDRPTISNLSAGEKAALDSLVSVNAVADPVEKIVTRGSTEIERQRTNYVFSASRIWRDNVFSSAGGGALEQVFDFVAYDTDGNILEYKGRDGLPVAIKYGYNNQLPIAKVINANHTQVFYESFEASGTVGLSKTGNKYHTGDYTLNLSTTVPNSILSYWYWQSNAWHFKQVFYSGGSHTITDGDRIDEVRIHPPGAVMTTFTYAPGVGTTSTSDPTGLMVSYEYDSFGRLIVVKDNQGNVVQNVKYNIVNQETNE